MAGPISFCFDILVIKTDIFIVLIIAIIISIIIIIVSIILVVVIVDCVTIKDFSLRVKEIFSVEMRLRTDNSLIVSYKFTIVVYLVCRIVLSF